MRKENQPRASKVEGKFLLTTATIMKDSKEAGNDGKTTKVPDKLILLKEFKEIILDDFRDGHPTPF